MINTSSIVGTSSNIRLDVRGLLRALADGWQAYLPALADLSANDKVAYLAAQGFGDTCDLLAHITAWDEETLGVVPVLLSSGEHPGNPGNLTHPESQRYEDQTFNAQAIARYSVYSSKEIERQFTVVNAALARMLALLPDTALSEPAVYHWLYTTIVEHFNEHRPPNLPGVA